MSTFLKLTLLFNLRSLFIDDNQMQPILLKKSILPSTISPALKETNRRKFSYWFINTHFFPFISNYCLTRFLFFIYFAHRFTPTDSGLEHYICFTAFTYFIKLITLLYTHRFVEMGFKKYIWKQQHW